MDAEPDNHEGPDVSRSGDRGRATRAPALGRGPRRSDVPGAAGVAGGLRPVPGVRGGASRQDPEEGPRRDRRRVAARRPCGAADGAVAAGGSPDRAGVRGLRIGQDADRTSRSRSAARGASTWRSRGCAVCRTRPDSARHCWPSSGSCRRAPPNAVLFAIDAEKRSGAGRRRGDPDAPCSRRCKGREVLLGAAGSTARAGSTSGTCG